MIEAEEVPSVTPQVIDFEKDVVINKINDRFTMISSKNPYNDIFTLCVTHNFGTINNPDINRAVTYWEMQGTQDKSFEEFSLELQKLGATIYIYCNQSNTNIVIEGFEKDLDRILALCEEKLNTPANDEKKKDIIAQNDQMEKETMKEDASTWGQAVRQYALYGEKSSYLTETPIKEWKKRTGEQLLNEVKDAVNYSGEVLFVGNLNPKDVIAALEKHNLVRNDVVKAEKQYRVENNFTENQIFMAHSKKFRQSNIFMHVPSETLNENEKAVSLVFNKYFGTDMYSIVFQEIREFRSLGYTAYSYFGYDYLNRKPGFLFGFLGTQSDKTNEGIEVFHNLITDMPERMEKFNASKDALILSRASDYISFRDIPSNVSTWLEMGYKNDPRQATTEIIKKTEYKDVYEFYKKNVADRPVIIMMSGNKKKIDMKALGKFGNVKELKYKEIFK